MTKRRLDTHEECLKAFSEKLRKEIKENLKAWSVMDPKQAQARRMAYLNIVFLLKETSREFDIPLVDLRLAIMKCQQSMKASCNNRLESGRLALPLRFRASRRSSGTLGR